MTEFTHFNASGEAHMVDVGDKAATKRKAISEGRITMMPDTLKMILQGTHKKGDVLGIARIAGIMAAKKAPDLIPLCHPLSLTKVEIDLSPEMDTHSILCHCHVETLGQTGVEIEALCATQICLLTIYDMCKAIDRGMTISDISLLEKSGGKSGSWKNNN
ncbi:MAG: cyclic pyranopterin monophosphate synthase MoaC [Candidatus Thiodiazotropha sp.]|jgi:cyclic pyranopterin monophosphate synthase